MGNGTETVREALVREKRGNKKFKFKTTMTYIMSTGERGAGKWEKHQFRVG